MESSPFMIRTKREAPHVAHAKPRLHKLRQRLRRPKPVYGPPGYGHGTPIQYAPPEHPSVQTPPPPPSAPVAPQAPQAKPAPQAPQMEATTHAVPVNPQSFLHQQYYELPAAPAKPHHPQDTAVFYPDPPAFDEYEVEIPEYDPPAESPPSAVADTPDYPPASAPYPPAAPYPAVGLTYPTVAQSYPAPAPAYVAPVKPTPPATSYGVPANLNYYPTPKPIAVVQPTKSPYILPPAGAQPPHHHTYDSYANTQPSSPSHTAGNGGSFAEPPQVTYDHLNYDTHADPIENSVSPTFDFTHGNKMAPMRAYGTPYPNVIQKPPKTSYGPANPPKQPSHNYHNPTLVTSDDPLDTDTIGEAQSHDGDHHHHKFQQPMLPAHYDPAEFTRFYLADFGSRIQSYLNETRHRDSVGAQTFKTAYKAPTEKTKATNTKPSSLLLTPNLDSYEPIDDLNPSIEDTDMVFFRGGARAGVSATTPLPASTQVRTFPTPLHNLDTDDLRDAFASGSAPKEHRLEVDAMNFESLKDRTAATLNGRRPALLSRRISSGDSGAPPVYDIAAIDASLRLYVDGRSSEEADALFGGQKDTQH